MKKILVFGHVPKYAGGKQSSGLANVIWQLAKNMNDVGYPDYKVILAATDIHDEQTKIEGVDIIGWNKRLLFKIILVNIHFAFYYILKALKLAVTYNFSFKNIYFKLLFYHYVLKRIKPDIVHLHGCTSVSFFEIHNFDKCKVIATIHGISGQDSNIPDYETYQKMEMKMNQQNFHFVGFITNQLITQWKKYYGEPNWHMIPILNAYDQSVFYYVNKDDNASDDSEKNEIVLATIASIGELKGQLRVIDALKQVNNRRLKYICIGEGTSEQVQDLLNAYKGHINFEYKGYLSPDQIREELKHIDYMILPSSSEGFGLVYLESIACGVPVILPKHLPLAQEPGLLTSENSILTENESSQAIVNVLLKLDKYHFNREKTANTVLKYGWKSVAREYIHYLKTI